MILCHTAEGYYIYIETSLPRRRDHKARLVSPTLAAIQPNSTCQVCKAVILLFRTHTITLASTRALSGHQRHAVHHLESRKRFIFGFVFNFQMDLYIHMKGSHIGALNIYQAPVVGFAVKKLSLSTDQGQNWVKRQVLFDSVTEFQVRSVKV